MKLFFLFFITPRYDQEYANTFSICNVLYIDQVECPAIGKTFLFMQSNSLSIGSKTVLFLFPSFMDLTLHSHRISNLKMWDICRSFKIRKEETTWFYLARCSGKRIKKVSLNPGTKKILGIFWIGINYVEVFKG